MTELFDALGLTEAVTGGPLAVHSPIDGARIASVAVTDPADMPAVIARA